MPYLGGMSSKSKTEASRYKGMLRSHATRNLNRTVRTLLAAVGLKGWTLTDDREALALSSAYRAAKDAAHAAHWAEEVRR